MDLYILFIYLIYSTKTIMGIIIIIIIMRMIMRMIIRMRMIIVIVITQLEP